MNWISIITDFLLPILGKLVKYLFKYIDKVIERKENLRKDMEAQDRQIINQKNELETEQLKNLREGMNWFVGDYIQRSKRRKVVKEAKVVMLGTDTTSKQNIDSKIKDLKKRGLFLNKNEIDHIKDWHKNEFGI